MSVDTNFTFYLIGSKTNDYFSLSDGNAIDFNHNTVKVYAFNGGNYYHLLPERVLSHVYLHCDLNSTTANGYMCDMMTDKEGFILRSRRWII
jgi:hypothetical protein